MLLAFAFLPACGGAKKDIEKAAERGAVRETSPAERNATRNTLPAIIALGNSLTAGLGVDQTENYPSKLQRKLIAAGYHFRVINAGVSGDTSAQGLNRLHTVLSARPALVIVELGANDGLRGIPVDETRRNLEAIIREIKSNGAKVLLAGMKVPPNYGSLYARDFERIFPSLADKEGVSLVPFFLDGVGGRAELNQEDGIHPTAKGYDLVTENVWSALMPMLR
jgi:acyl-CoA thioesterase I